MVSEFVSSLGVNIKNSLNLLLLKERQGHQCNDMIDFLASFLLTF